MSKVRHIIGCMTGTSLDGLDAALVRIVGEGLTLKAELVEQVSAHFDDALREGLRQLATGQPCRAIDIMRLARQLGELHAQVVQPMTQKQSVDLIVLHGQTVWHAPQDEVGAMSWQLIDPWPVVRRCAVPVVYDLRQADLIAGGQGAPITPLADWILFRSDTVSRALVNLGGICNITWLPKGCQPGDVQGEDVGPCNLLLDGLVQRLFGLPYDEHGRLAARGGGSSLVYRLMMQAPFFNRPRPRSTGREDFSPAWIDQLIRDTGLPNYDMLASAVDAVAHLITEATIGVADEVILAGGGAKNKALERRLRELGRDQVKVRLLSELGVAGEAREAMEFAVLGALAMDGVRLTLPQITGCDQPGKFGTWVYP